MAGALVAMAAAIIFAGRNLTREPGAPIKAPAALPGAASPAVTTSQRMTTEYDALADVPEVIDDDGRTMWVSPTSGQPLSLNWLPQGVQMILALRPNALVAHPEGEKVLAALGPLGSEGVRAMEQVCGVPLIGIQLLVIGWQLDGNGNLDPTLVFYGAETIGRLLGETGHQRGDRWQIDTRAYYRPQSADGPSLVVAASNVMDEMIAGLGEPPALRREMARLLAQTDADRHVTLLVAPGVLFGEGRDLWAGHLAGLRRPLDWLLGDSLTAASMSLHWDASFFVEVWAAPTLDAPPDRVAEALAARVANLPDRVESYVLGLETSPHGRRVVSRLPAMARKLATYTRSGFERDVVLLRCYLPAVAGQNLLLGAELALAEGAGVAGSVAEATAPIANWTIKEKLQQRTSLRMPRDTLEAVLANLGRAIGVEIVIQSADLQADGITKNQSLALDIQDRTGEEILVEILRQANPDKSAAGPADPRQKLVYAIGPKRPGGPEVIVITTRSRAAERGETLPDVFGK